MAKTKKVKRAKKLKNMGSKLTCLTNKQSKIFLEKYEKAIVYLCRKRSYIPGIDIEDLKQECRIKLLAGYHLFSKKKKTKESTWAMSIIRKTLDGIWDFHLKEQRTCYVSEGDGMKPVYNYSFDNVPDSEGEKISFQELYSNSPDGRPVFGTVSESPEDHLFLFHVLEFLKASLSKEFYEYIRNKVFPDNSYEEIIQLEEKFRKELFYEGFTHLKEEDEYIVYCNFSGLEDKEYEILRTTALLMINHLDFSRKDIFDREKMNKIAY